MKAKAKGSRIEREIVSRHEAAGIEACRVIGSGAYAAASDDLRGDVHVTIGGRRLVAEVKARSAGAGFKTLERWLGDNDLLFLRRDRAEPLVAMPFAVYAEIIKGR